MVGGEWDTLLVLGLFIMLLLSSFLSVYIMIFFLFILLNISLSIIYIYLICKSLRKKESLYLLFWELINRFESVAIHASCITIFWFELPNEKSPIFFLEREKNLPSLNFIFAYRDKKKYWDYIERVTVSSTGIFDVYMIITFLGIVWHERE